MKFAITPFAARQFVSHGHLLVNGKRLNIPSYLVKDSDSIEVRDKSKQLAVVLDAAQSTERDVPEYLEVDHRAMKGRFARAPKLTDVPYPVQMEPNLVVEFYSRAEPCFRAVPDQVEPGGFRPYDSRDGSPGRRAGAYRAMTTAAAIERIERRLEGLERRIDAVNSEQRADYRLAARDHAWLDSPPCWAGSPAFSA